jgi:hypothetical protein
LRDAPMLLEQVIWKSKSCNTLAKIMIIAPTTWEREYALIQI